MDKFLLWLGGMIIGVGIGMNIANATNSYNKCSSQYETPDDIMECIWILENK